MSEHTNPSIDSNTTASSKAAYKFMASKKEPSVENEQQETHQEIVKNVASEITDNKPKDSPRKKRGGASMSYADTFLTRYELSSRQGLHLEKETIATIKRIIQIGDERLTVSGFVENVLKHHFECYKEDVNRLHAEKMCKPIQ